MDTVSYTIAEWLVHNKELFSQISNIALSELAVNNSTKEEAVEVILEELSGIISRQYPEMNRIEIKESFQEDEVKTILNTYYLKGLIYEH